jgi:hypothetical protein
MSERLKSWDAFGKAVERQLGLFKGPRQRGIVPRSQATEFELQCAIVQAFRVSKNKGWRLVAIPNGGLRDKVTAAKLRASGTHPGVPDLLLIGPGKICFLEIKTKYGRLTPEQEEFLSYLSSVAAEHAVAWSYDEAMAALKRWGAVRVSL